MNADVKTFRTVCVVALLAASIGLGCAARRAPAAATAAPQAAVKLPNCPEVARALQDLVRSDARLRDWPDLARYRDANRLLPPAAPEEARVVFMGDSITDLWQQPQFGGFFPGKPYVDRGISGQTTPQMLVRFRPDVIDLAPTHVYLDYFSAMTDASGLLQEDLSADDLHPNVMGYAVMAPLAEEAIQRALTR